MPILRISDADAARDFAAVLARVRAGEEVVIESDPSPPVVLRAAPRRHTRLLSESLRIARERGLESTLDAGFARDLEHAIASHPEPLDLPWD